MIVEMKGSAGGRVWLYNWFGGESMWICASRVAGQASFTVYQGLQQESSSEHLKVKRLMCKWPSTLTLYLTLCVCVCVCLCLCPDCGERCDLTAEWCAAWCEDWEPINTLPFFTPHICLVLIVLLKIVWLSCGCRYECIVLQLAQCRIQSV